MSQEQDWSAPGSAQAYQQPQGPNNYAPGAYPQPPAGVYQQPPGYPMVPVTQVAPKNPGIALLISFFIPGVGSMYAGKMNTGVIILVCYVISWVLTIVLIGFLGVFGFWIWGMIDAYQAAQSWNRARGIES